MLKKLFYIKLIEIPTNKKSTVCNIDEIPTNKKSTVCNIDEIHTNKKMCIQNGCTIICFTAREKL